MRKADKVQVRTKHKVKPLLIVVTVFMCLVFGFSLFWYVRSLLPVKNMVVAGSMQYEKHEIVNASGIKEGDRLYKIDSKKVREKLLEECLYLEDVKIEKKFPNTVIFRVEEKTPAWYVEVSGTYYVLDEDMLVIDELYSNQKMIDSGVPRIVLPNLSRMICGETAVFGSDENENARVIALLEEIQSIPFKSRITLVDMESRFDISVEVDGKHDVYIGRPEKVKEKLLAVENILERQKNDETWKNGAEINASLVPQPVTGRPKY